MITKALGFGLLALGLWAGAASGLEVQAGNAPFLGSGARVIETRSLKSQGFPHRLLALWMIAPKLIRYDRPGEIYTCPDETRGTHYAGPARVSLIDTARNRVVNTVDIRNVDGDDSLDLPITIRPGYYYRSSSRSPLVEGIPTIMQLADFTGEGRPIQFPLYDKLACMPVVTTLIGYVPEIDRVVNYPIRLSVNYQGQTTVENNPWLDYLFLMKPTAPGAWHYEVDYTGRGGSLDSTDVRFDRASRQFVASRVSRDPQR